MQQINDSETSSAAPSDSDHDSTLPYPEALSRNDFLAPDFKPSTYLSTLHNRHQTLEDLRSELRSRSQLLSKELLDLVNSNYQDFLGLGTSLKNGDERVEEVRVGLLGFRKDVESVRGAVAEREHEARELLDERVQVRKRIDLGRRLVEYEERLKGLEGVLMVESAGRPPNGIVDVVEAFSDSEDDDDDDEEAGAYSMSIGKLREHVLQYRLVQQIAQSTNKDEEEHPFITAQAPRVMRVRNTILLDLGAALKQARNLGAAGSERTMRVMKVYADMDESAEAVKVLKGLKKT